MALKYALRENHLTADPDDYMAYTQSTGTIDENGLIKDMVNRGSTVTEADIVSVLKDTLKSMKSFLEQGYSIVLPYANFSLSIKGVFNGKTDAFDPSRHQISLNVQPGSELRNFIKSGIQTEKVETVILNPVLSEYKDLVSGERNSIVTPGGMGQILGYRLKFDSTNPEEGIFFVKADNSEFKVSIVGDNKPSRLMFMIPAELTSGEYKLQVRAKAGDDLRTGELKEHLSVA